MLHRLKLRVLHGEQLDADKAARRAKFWAILLSGFGTYPPFFAVAYWMFFETGPIRLIWIGLFCAVICIPVVFYTYAKGFGAPIGTLWKKRRAEMLWLGLKIGFIYPFVLYWVILGIVDFLFGYNVVRAAMVSFVATAVARDGFEIGYLRARSSLQEIHIFPDNQSICLFWKATPLSHAAIATMTLAIAGAIGFGLGPFLANPRYQTVAVGMIGGTIATAVYVKTIAHPISQNRVVRFFLWPGLTMAASYFLGLAYILRHILPIQLSPASDLALLTALSSVWLTLETRFLGHLKRQRIQIDFV